MTRRRREASRLLVLCLSVCLLVAAGAADRPRIRGLSHLALYVHDLDAARTYYREVLGFGEQLDLNDADGRVATTLVKIGSRQYVELVPEREAGTDRLAHVAVETDQADALRMYLQSRGVAVPQKVSTDRAGDTSFSVTDPDGHLVEFVQYARNGWMARSRSTSSPDALSTDMRHVGILVGALEPAMKFYRDVLGFKEIWRGSRDEKELNWVNMQVPDGEAYIEFMLYRDLPEPTRRGTQHHLCLFVPDIDKATAVLRARAARGAYSRPLDIRTGTNRKRQLNLFDPDGTRTELMESRTVDGKPAPSSTAPPPR